MDERTAWLLKQCEYLAQHEAFVHAWKAIDMRPVQQQANEASPRAKVGVDVRGHKADLPRISNITETPTASDTQGLHKCALRLIELTIYAAVRARTT